MRKRLLVALGLVVALSALAGSAALAQGPGQVMPPHAIRADYAIIKAAIDAHTPLQGRGGPQVSANTPTTSGSGWSGQGATNYSPSDSNGAIGVDRYIELVNVSIGVYDRTTHALLSQNSQAAWTGNAHANGDAAIEYSAHDQRFYASMLYINGSNYQLIYGFSKGQKPSALPADWCFYQSTFGSRYGSNLPDYPKLGDTADFILIGVNTFRRARNYVGSDVAWVRKPPAATTLASCPSLATGVLTNIKNADGSAASTPNPAKQTDTSSTGYVVANKDPGSGSGTVLSVFTVTKSSSGTPVLSAAKTVSVSSYAYPPSAPQAGTNDKLDTLDARLMSAWASPDPNHGGAVAVWTGHTVAASSGGLGAEFRWYEINPGTGALYQQGKVQSSSAYVFMGAISSDRNGAAGLFGGNAAMVFNTSSGSAYPAAAMASVVNGAASGIVTVATSPAADTDFTCTPVCRWGDYSGASPDPASSSTGTEGVVWGTVMMETSNPTNPNWGSFNWAANP